MLDFTNLPPDFWNSLEFVCIFFGLLPLILFHVIALLLLSVDIVRDSRWYKNQTSRTVYVQTDEDTELMEFYASGASPLDLNPDSSSNGSTTPPYPSTSNSESTSASPPEPSSSSSSAPASTSHESPSTSSGSNQAPKPSSSPSQTTQLAVLPETDVEHQPYDSGIPSSDNLDGWTNFNGWSSPPPPPPPPKITSMLLKNTSTGNLSTGKSPSFQRSTSRMSLTANSDSYNEFPGTSKNPFANSVKTAAKSDDVEFFDYGSGTYCKSPFNLWDEDFSSPVVDVQPRPRTSETAFGEAGSSKTLLENRMSPSSDTVYTRNGTDCQSSIRSSLGGSSMKSASSDPYLSEVYMGVV